MTTNLWTLMQVENKYLLTLFSDDSADPPRTQMRLSKRAALKIIKELELKSTAPSGTKFYRTGKELADQQDYRQT